MNEPVLVCVDDEKFVLNSLRRELYEALDEQYLIETAESGEEALEVVKELLAEEHEIPLLLIDQIMPGMKGHELLKQLHPLIPDTLTIMLTGQAELASVVEAVNHANLYRYIAKPWEQTDLILTVKEAIYKYFQEKKLAEQHRMLQVANQELELLNIQMKDYSHSLEEKVAERTAELEKANRELRRLANLDGLTRLANRRRFDEYLTQEWRRLAREQMPLSLILCDIDYFKRYNDTYGHQAGDECLQKIADVLKQVAERPADLAARYGGEEFTIILPNTDADGALHIAHKMQRMVRKLDIAHTESTISQYVTLSIGISWTIPQHASSPNDLVALADKALYEAKDQGRNRVIIRPFHIEE
jgi:diguanylate cyclase (GGDEF)-like protein